MSKLKYVLFVFCVLSPLMAARAQQQSGQDQPKTSWWNRSIWSNPERGTLWYPLPSQDQDSEDPTPQQTKPQAAQAEKTTPAKPPEVAEFKKLQEQLSDARMVYFMSPTPENVKAYIELQEKVFAQSAVTADVWRRVLWADPQLQYQGRPTNQTGVTMYDQRYTQNVRDGLSGLAQTHGVYFFFRSDCPYCHAMAPTIHAIEKLHGIKVIAVSLDGKGIKEFPDAIIDNGQASRLGVKTVPSYFLAAPSLQTVLPLGSGVVSLGELEERIYTQAYTRPGDKF